VNAEYGLHRRLVAGLFIGLLFSVFHGGQATAATSGPESITLSPVSKYYKLDPGETRNDELTVINDGTTPYSFTVYTKPYSVKDENYEPDFVTVGRNATISSWIKPERTSYFLEPGESTKVVYTITAPKDAAPGGHYGVIFAETQPMTATEGTSVQRKKRVGTIIYATVNGEYRVGGKFLSVSTPTFQFKPPLQSDITVENTGNTDFAVSMTHTVSDVFGNQKFTESKNYQVLPKTTRKTTLQWQQAPNIGLYKVTVSADFLDENTRRDTYVLMAPVWTYLLLLIGIVSIVIYFVLKAR
jgi:hypothetical protein